jgi:hypothetical protein
MPYVYETHLLTCQGSSCGVSRGREYVQRYLDLGYTGIIVTDHFFNGNCRPDRNLPWKKWVRESCRGYEDARNEGERRGLDVFYGWEETFDSDDYLVYGLDGEWLLDHEEAKDWTRKEQFEEVRRNGGCVVQAHPFRSAYYISSFHLSTGCVDAVEAANSGNHQSSDALALLYAEKLRLPITAGSDIHYAGDIRPDTVFGVYLDRKMESISDFVYAVRNNAIREIKVPAGRFDNYKIEYRMAPVDIRDKEDRSTGDSLKDFLGL